LIASTGKAGASVVTFELWGCVVGGFGTGVTVTGVFASAEGLPLSVETIASPWRRFGREPFRSSLM
jgi:hypothetical protein